MKYFENYSSNTCAGSGNQLYFNMPDKEVRTGRIFYKISAGGKYGYSLLFSNIIDGTYSDGTVSHNNLICGSWKIHGARIGRCKNIPQDKDISEMTVADSIENKNADIVVSDWKVLTFGGQVSKEVMPGEFFASDSVSAEFGENEYMCLELTFSGRMIPYHEESLLPVFIKDKSGWKYCKYMPFAGMIGCDRSVKGKIAYLGDSITQGIGTAANSYMHWNAELSRKIGSDYAFWNLGIGYGRASDAASDGAWLYKAKQNDVVFVCYGVNDILKGRTEEQIKSDLSRIVEILTNAGKKVILQTIPPFDYTGEDIGKWNRINTYIKTVPAKKVALVFDNTPYLGKKDAPHMSKFGAHPNEEGCAIWAEALFEEVKNLF